MIAPRLRLRPLTYADWPRVHEWASVPQVSRYQDWGPNTEAETQAFARAAVQGWSRHPRRQHVWAAVDTDDGPVGNCEVDLRGSGVAEIGMVREGTLRKNVRLRDGWRSRGVRAPARGVAGAGTGPGRRPG